MEDEEAPLGSDAACGPHGAVLPLAVIVERSASRHPWGSDIWRAAEIMPALPTRHPWRLLRREAGRDLFLADDAVLTLHRADVASYRFNLASRTPFLFVLLRAEGEGMRVALLTAAPDEAESLMENGELVEAVPMPPAVRQWIEAFAAGLPPDPPMYKRQRV